MDKIFWWVEDEKEKEELLKKESEPKIYIEDIIEKGETDQIEFKKSLFDKEKIGKTICAFLNTNGGFIFIGIDDNKNVVGSLKHPKFENKENPRDFFRIQFDNLLKQFVPLFIKSQISGDFISLEGKDIFLVKVFPSKYKPVFFKGNTGKEFYIRLTASNTLFKDIEDIVDYCIDHWSKK